MRQITELSHRDAQTILTAIAAELERTNQAASIAVVDSHGELLAFLRMDGCPLPPIANAINKAYTAARERSTSRRVGERSREEGFPMTNFADLRYIGWGGGVPVMVDGVSVGAVGVSGVPEEEDMRLAALGVAAL